MKQEQNTKTLIKLISPIIVISFFLALNSCEKENEQELQRMLIENTKNPFVSIDIAREWYMKRNEGKQIYLQSSKGMFRSTNKGEIFSFPQPDWECGTIAKTGHIIAVDVNLQNTGAIHFVTEQNYNAFHQTNDEKYARSLSRLVILSSSVIKDVTLGCIMTVLPSKEYVSSHEDRIKKISYLQRDPDFDGMILFHRLNGKYANGWVYENGKITKTITDQPSDKKNIQPIDINILKAGHTRSVEESIEQEPLRLYAVNDSIIIEDPIIDGGSFPDVIINGSYTPYPDYYIGIILNCLQSGNYYTDPVPGPNPWDPGGGGGGGGYIPATDEVILDKSLGAYGLDKIFDCIANKAKSPFVKNLLHRFYGSDAEFDVTYMVGEIPADYDDSNGFCDFSTSLDSIEGNEYKKGVVILNKDRIENRSSLEIIRTMLHETMHAYIHSYLYTKDPKIKTTTLDKDFDTYKETLEQGSSGAQEHNFMAENWVDTLAQELMKLHQTQENYNRFWEIMKDRGVDIANKDIYYKALAWQGLEKTHVYSSLDKNDKAKQKKYLDAAYKLNSKKWECKE